MKRLALTALAAGLGLALCGGEVLAQRRGNSSGGGGRSSSGGGRSWSGGGRYSSGGGGYQSRPAYRPASVSRPSVRPFTDVRPTPRPVNTTRSVGRPTTRPQLTTRPAVRPISRPTATQRPAVRPITRPQLATLRSPNSNTGPKITTRPGKIGPVTFNPGSGKGPGKIVTPPSRGRSNYHLTHGRKSHFGFSYHGRNHRHWTHRCWSNHHRCWTYWDAGCRRHYYWCSPDQCFYPCSHCPHGTFNWDDDNYCVTSCPAIDCQSDDPTTVAVEEDAGSEVEQGLAYGMEIQELDDGSARDQGMKLGDIIVRINGQATTDFDALRAALEAAGSEAEVDFINVDNGELERIVLFPDDTRIGATVDQVEI